MSEKALIIIDLQNDFMPGGALAVPDAHAIIPLANQIQNKFKIIIATKDWHPAHHGSFHVNHAGRQIGEVIELEGLPQIMWPTHCVQESKGAELVPGLDTDKITKVIHKGTDVLIDSYSAFFDNAHRRSTGLAEYLKANSVTEVYLLGVATDYCVKYSALDACKLGFKTYVIADACRGVNLQPEDSKNAFQEMQAAGAEII